MRLHIFLVLLFLFTGCHTAQTTSEAQTAGDGGLNPGCHPSPATQAILNLVYKNGIVDPKMIASDLPQKRLDEDRGAKAVLASIPVASVRDLQIDSGGAKIPVRIYQPEAKGDLPIVLFIHGGGWSLGSIASYDSITREMASFLPAVVVSVGYRLAPEFPFPSAVEDVLAALKWTVKNTRSLGGDPRRLVLAGDSAGGSLTAVMARKAAELKVPVALQLLIYPSTDLGDTEYPSYKKLGQGYFLTETGLRSLRGFYLPKSTDWNSPDASPLRASDLSLKSVAPAYFLLAGCDPLRDEGLAYARRLQGLGVPVSVQWETGMVHGFLGSFNNASVPKVAAEVEPIFVEMLSRVRGMLR